MAFIRIFITTVAGTVSVTLLAAFSGMFKALPKNGFERTFKSTVQEVAIAQRPDDLTNFIGVQSGRYFFSSKSVSKVYSLNRQLDDLIVHNLPIKVIPKWQKSFRHLIMGDSLYSWAPQVPSIFSFRLSNPTNVIKTPLPYTFTRGQQISRNEFIVRSFDPTDSLFEQIFLKFNRNTGEVLKNQNITPLLNDGGMLTDGDLHFDSSTHNLLFVHFFSNKIIWIDTNLNVVRRGHTIDTSFHINGSIAMFYMGKTKKVSYDEPPNIVNISNQLYEGYLVNYSGKRADNQEGRFLSGSCLDIYRVVNGEYLESLYVPPIKQRKMESFQIVDDKLIAIYKSQVVIYDISETILVRK